ncbi:MAG TPA: hypothetical protein VFN26_23855 [Candidatus Acidoferrum sp.]|nr:hypothetical protein [Candidatus Acidoferrum sp.]
MAKYLVRVELHGGTWDDYEVLHAEMADRGFARKITGGNGRSYQLPTAEYVIHADNELEGVRGLAAEAAKVTGHKFGVIVAEYSRSAWVGLEYA